MSAENILDTILNSHDGFVTTYQRKMARSELAALRAAAAERDRLQAIVDAQAAQLEQAHIPEMIRSLVEIMDFVFSKEPCGYYCDPLVGHVDHKYTNWLRSIVGDLRTLAAHAPAPAPEEERTG